MKIHKKLRSNIGLSEPYDMFNLLTDTEKTENRLRAAIASQIVKKRHSDSISQATLAEKIGVQQPMVSQLESGDYNYTVSKIAQIACALGLDVDIIFSDKRTKNTTHDLSNPKIVSFPKSRGGFTGYMSANKQSFAFVDKMEG